MQLPTRNRINHPPAPASYRPAPGIAGYFFWRNQNPDTRYPYLFLLLVTLATVVLGVYYYFTADDSLIRWVKVPHLQPVDALINQFSVAGQAFEIKANGYLLTERYDASLPQKNLPAAYIFLGLTGLCLAYFLTVASTLKRYVFLAAMLLFLFFLINFNLVGLNEFSPLRKFLVYILYMVLALTAYSFQAFFPTVSFTRRLLLFTGLVALTGALVFWYSTYPPHLTALHIVNHSALATMAVSFLFILWVAYELIHALVWVNTQARNPQRRFGMYQFMFISLLYLANLSLLFLEEAGIFRLGLVYLDAFVVLFLSALAGFWGLRKREELYGNLVAFWPGAAFLYLIFAIITFLSIGYVFATANDPLIASYNTIIIYAHLAIGAVFFLYVMINFGRLLAQKLQVYKVIYDPKTLPFFPVYVMGGIALLGLIVRTNALSYSQAKAGYYNYLGDLYKLSGESLLAERFYQESDVFEHYNVKANYSLAGISREKNARSAEIVYLKEALMKRPHPKVYARLASLFEDQTYFFEQQFTLKQGLEKFPKDAMLNNNMAVLYNKTALADSVLHYYNIAENYSPEEEVLQSNKLAFLIKNALPEQALLLAEENQKLSYVPWKSNLTLLQHLVGKPSPEPELPAADAGLDIPGFSLLYHSILNRLHEADTSAIEKLQAYSTNPANANFTDDLTLLKGSLQRYHQQPLQAKVTLENLSRTSGEGTGYYQDILGLWMLEDHLYLAAADYFGKARSNGFPEAALHEAQALALAGRKGEAATAAQELLASENPELVKTAQALLTVLSVSPEQARDFANETHKVQFIAFQPVSANLDLSQLVNSIQDPELKMEAENLVLRRLLSRNDLAGAQQYAQSLPAGKAEPNNVNSDRNRLALQLWARAGNLEALRQNLDKLYMAPEAEPEKLYYQALLAEAEKKPKEAGTLYDKAVKLLPYHPDALLNAARFYRDGLKDDFRAYDILLTGITYNPFSAPLYQAYVLHSLNAGFENYAAAGMEQLETLLNPEEYATFNRQYQAALAKRREAAAGWD